jgi:hypothetical protein
VFSDTHSLLSVLTGRQVKFQTRKTSSKIKCDSFPKIIIFRLFK